MGPKPSAARLVRHGKKNLPSKRLAWKKTGRISTHRTSKPDHLERAHGNGFHVLPPASSTASAGFFNVKTVLPSRTHQLRQRSMETRESTIKSVAMYESSG
jgi:hypothetical protein